MLELLKTLIYGIVEGITEWLPISSTGHLILVEQILPLDRSPEFLEMFRVVIQLGAILAVVILYWERLFPFQFKEKPYVKKDIFSMWFKVLVACIPTIIIGMPFDDLFESLFYNYICVAIVLFVFGVLFIIVEQINKERSPKITNIAQLTYRTAFLIGIFQLVAAIFPGTSRSGITILGAIILGVSRTTAAEFTFFLSVPVMLGASLLKIVKFGFDFTSAELSVLLVGMISAFVVSLLAIRFLMGYIKKHDFKVFGWYRIILAIVVVVYFMLQG